MNRSHAQPGVDQSTASTGQPALRLRDDQPADGIPAKIDGVLDQVENLSTGIDAMLLRAARSSVGSAAASAVDDETDIEDASGEPMMAMFADEEPADIQAIDRMLAGEAEQAIAQPIAHPTSSETAAANDEPEFTIEGDFESIETVLTSNAMASNRPSQIGVALIAEPIIAATQAAGLQAQVKAAAQSSKPADIDVHSQPTSRVDLSLAPTQAAGIAAALAAASATAAPVAAVAASASQTVHAVVAAVPEQAATMPSVAPSQTESPSPEPAVSAPRATGGAGSPVDRRANAGAIEAAARSPQLPSRGFAGGIVASVARIIALTNLPLRFVPESLRPAVNMLAISLAMWAPAVWAIAPMMAARQTSNTLPDVEMPTHGESSVDPDTSHGETKAEDSHGSESHGAKKATKPASSRRQSAGKASTSRTSDDGKAAAAHH